MVVILTITRDIAIEGQRFAGDTKFQRVNRNTISVKNWAAALARPSITIISKSSSFDGPMRDLVEQLAALLLEFVSDCLSLTR